MNLIISKFRTSIQQMTPWTLSTDTQRTGKDCCNVQNQRGPIIILKCRGNACKSMGKKKYRSPIRQKGEEFEKAIFKRVIPTELRSI